MVLPLIAAAIVGGSEARLATAVVGLAGERSKRNKEAKDVQARKKEIAQSATTKIETVAGKGSQERSNVIPFARQIPTAPVTGNPIERMTQILTSIDRNIVVLTDTISSFLFSTPEPTQLTEEGVPREQKIQKKNKFLEGLILALVAPALIGLIGIFDRHVKPILTKLKTWYEKVLKPLLFEAIPKFFGEDIPEFFNVTVPEAFDSAISKVKTKFDSVLDGFQKLIRDTKIKIGTWMKEVGTKMSNNTLPGAIEIGGSLISAGNRMIDSATGTSVTPVNSTTQAAVFATTGRVVPQSQRSGGTPVSEDTSNKVYSTGASLIGKSETTNNQELQNFFQANIKKKVDPKKTKWCAAFVNSVLAKNGIEGTGSLAASSFETFGEPTATPRKGDIVVLNHHVGFFDGFNPNGSVRVLGGNQGNEVGIDTFARSSVIGFRRITGSRSPQTINSTGLQTPSFDRSVASVRIPPAPTAPATPSAAIPSVSMPRQTSQIPMRSPFDVPAVDMPPGAMATHLFYRY